MPNKKRSLLVSILTTKCPRCRQGNMYAYPPYSLHFLKMNDECPHCGLHFELETGFWWGTGYVSYALSVGVSVASFVAWLLTIGMSVHDNRPFYWLGFNAVLLVIMIPLLMRISRSLWIAFFVGYEPGNP